MNGAERLCTWYLRLNGYLTTANFYAHDRHETLGEVDVIGVRFPYSRELSFKDDEKLSIPEGKTDVVLAESKIGPIKELSNSWKSLEYVMQRIGITNSDKTAQVCDELRKKGSNGLDHTNFRIVYFGESLDEALVKKVPKFVAWSDVLSFIRSRFYDNERLKAQHEQWECFGQYLWGRLASGDVPDVRDFFCAWQKLDSK